MRIVHVIKHCGYGNGSVHVAVDLACMQAKAGHDVVLVSKGGTFVPLLEQYGVRHITLNHDQNKPFSMLRTMWKLARLGWHLQPDVLHAHMMSSALVGYGASLVTGVPLVTTVHNSFDGHSLIMRLGRRVVAVSEAERKQLLRKGYNPRHLVAVMNAPDESPREGFLHDEKVLAVDSPCIVTTNALHRRKGVFDLIEACEELFREFPKWKLYIAGEGPDREVLEEQVREAGLTERVIFLGFLASPRPLLERSDIFVLASYADPCSLAVGEARSAGCAIVATAVGGTPEMLDFGRAGRLVAPGKPEELRDALRDLMANETERLKLRKAALEGAEVFRAVRLVEEYGRVYEQAIGSDRRKMQSLVEAA